MNKIETKVGVINIGKGFSVKRGEGWERYMLFITHIKSGLEYAIAIPKHRETEFSEETGMPIKTRYISDKIVKKQLKMLISIAKKELLQQYKFKERKK